MILSRFRGIALFPSASLSRHSSMRRRIAEGKFRVRLCESSERSERAANHREKKVDTIKRYYRVDRREIFFIQSIFEGYDGLVTISTVDPNRGVIRLSIPPGTETDVSDILQDLKTSGILIEAVVPVSSRHQDTKARRENIK